MKWIAAAGACALATMPTPAWAGEIFGGVFKHDVETPLTASGNIEEGLDLQLGWRGGRIAGTPVQPYLFGSLNSAGDTHYVAAGVSAKFGDALYVRPGVGLALHTGSSARFQHFDHDHVDFGSRILFAPEIAIGARVAPRISVEASLVHLSHGQLFGRQNPGIDNIGVRVNVALP